MDLVENFLKDLFLRLHVTEISCALIYFCLVDYFSNVFGKLPILPRIPMFLFIVTSILTLLSYMTIWFALQRFIKTVLIYGLGLETDLVSTILQPSFALLIALWSLDAILDDYALPGVPCNVYILLLRSINSCLCLVASLILKLIRVIFFPAKCVFRVVGHILCRWIGLGLFITLTFAFSFAIWGLKGTLYSYIVSKLEDYKMDISQD